ncbi:MAG: hypothetical protein JRH20_15210, partial [Deltaproteobacteria bacterium]|nr:hypothetical protein [Deltaproteobacteria bacterium]
MSIRRTWLSILALVALAPALAPTLVFATPNRHAQTLLRGKVVRGVPLHGKAITHYSGLKAWHLDLNPHQNPGDAWSARVLSLECPSRLNKQSKPRVDGPGDTVRFTSVVEWNGGTPNFGVALHTNANLPGIERFDNFSMTLQRRVGNKLHYAIDLPIYSAGNYKAKAVLVKDGHVLKGGADAWSPGGDHEFRPYFREHDRIRELLVNVANLGPGKYGTFEDMIGHERIPNSQGKYTLSQMQANGTTAIRLLPHASHIGSPYSKVSYFDVMVDHSAPAMQIRGQIENLQRARHPDHGRVNHLKGEMYKAAMTSFRTFADLAHKKGIRIFLDYIANHTGPDVRMLDAFFYEQSTGKPMDIFNLYQTAGHFAMRQNDPSQLAVNGRHYEEILHRMDQQARSNHPISLQYSIPQLFAKYHVPQGAQHIGEIADGGFWEWKKPGSWQLNHGRHRHGFSWFDLPQSPESRSLRGMLKR